MESYEATTRLSKSELGSTRTVYQVEVSISSTSHQDSARLAEYHSQVVNIKGTPLQTFRIVTEPCDKGSSMLFPFRRVFRCDQHADPYSCLVTAVSSLLPFQEIW
jgi:hypothetical protein